MFVLRGLDGKIVTITEMGKEEKEEQHETYEQAQQALKEMERSIPKGTLRIVAKDCERCGGENDVAIIHVDDEPKAYCQSCRFEMFTPKNPVGRPSVGVTKKVSLTLSEENWELFDEKAEGNRSKFLREIVGKTLVNESEEAVSMKPTFISYCAECRKNFREGETCNYTWYENNVFCHDCKEIMNTRVTESYLEWQLRVYAK